MFLHLRAVVNQLYARSENELRICASSVTAGRYETFYITCPGGLHDRAIVEIRAVADNAILGLDAEGYLGSGRAPKLQLAIQKIGGKPGAQIEDGDTIALRKPKPSWFPWQQYVRIAERGGLRFAKGGRDKDCEFVFVKAREILEVTLPKEQSGRGTVRLKDLTAPPGGVPIQIESSHPEIVQVEESVLIPEGLQEGQFAFSRRTVAALPDDPIVITARELALPDSVCHAPVPPLPAAAGH